jgi:hypothetical protein
MGLMPLRAAAWGRDGHQIVAAIALWRLEQLKARNAQNSIDAIFRATPETSIPLQPRDLLAAAVWPDDVRGEDRYRFADNLHFVSIELKKDGMPDRYFRDRFCKTSNNVPQIPEGVCIIGALEHYTRVLANPSATNSARIEALAFVAHFMGDVHQPLHTSEDKNFINHLVVNGQNGRGDRGGNHRFIFYLANSAFASNNIKSCVNQPNSCTESFDDESSNRKLHTAWDRYMIRTEMNTNPNRQGFEAYGIDLVKQLPPSPIAEAFTKMEEGNFVTWAEEAHHLAELNAYDLVGPRIKISPADGKKYRFYLLNDAYRARNIRIIDQQLIRAGIRLAAVLRKIFPES